MSLNSRIVAGGLLVLIGVTITAIGLWLGWLISFLGVIYLLRGLGKL